MDAVNLEICSRFVSQFCSLVLITCEAGLDKQIDKSWKTATRLRSHMTQFWRGGHGEHSASSQCCCCVVLKVKEGQGRIVQEVRFVCAQKFVTGSWRVHLRSRHVGTSF